jgi:Tfp pilus assembly protein PilX
MIRRLRKDEGGWVLMTAIGLLAVMASIAAATAGVVDTQTRESGVTRTKETAFNLAEAALNAQIFALARDWPGQGRQDDPYPVCTPASTSARCPSAATISTLFASPDTATSSSWETIVRDNNASQAQSFYSDELAATAPAYDSNGDGRVWVRAEGVAAGRKRTLIALVRVDEIFEEMPRGAVIAGRIDLDNQGKKVMIDGTNGSYPTVTVRCSRNDGVCLGHGWVGDPVNGHVDGKFEDQVWPPTFVDNYGGGDATTPEARERLKATAAANGDYYPSCPPEVPSGPVVWIESGNCRWTGNGGGNSEASPGLLIINNGTLYFGGTTFFHGIVYALNPTLSAGTVVDLQGNTEVIGGVLIDGPGSLSVGSSKLNVKLDQRAWNAARSYTNAGMIQNTWREIKSD